MDNANEKIVMVYDLQTLGGKETYQTLNGINTIFKEIAANKTSLNGVFNLNFDVGKLETVSKSFTQIVASNKELIVYIKTLTTEISKFGQIGQQTTTALASSMNKMNMATMANITGFQQFQASVNTSALTTETYIAMVNVLRTRVNELNTAIADNTSAYATLNQQRGQGIVSQQEYAAETNQIRLSQVELKAQLQATEKELATLNQLWHATSEVAAESNIQIASNKVQLSEHNIELKQQAKLALAAEGSIDELSISLGLLRDKYRQLSEAEREGVTGRDMLLQIQRMDTEVKTLDKSIGNSQRNVGNYGSALSGLGGKVEQFVVRDLFRATAGFIVFNLLFESVQKLWDAMPSKIDKSTEAMDQFNFTLTKQLDEFIDLQKALQDYFNAGESLYKRQVEVARAKGVVNGEVYKNEKEIFDAEQNSRAKELSDLGDIAGKYHQVEDIFQRFDKYGDLNATRNRLKALGLDPAELKAFNKEINEYLEARSKLSDKDKAGYKLAENTDLVKKQADVQNQIFGKEQDIENAKAELQNKLDRLRYEKNIELADQLVQIREQRREEEQRDEVNSVEKITADVRAKYAIMYNDIHKKMTELAKQFPDDKLPDDLQKKYDTIVNNVRKIEEAERRNQTTAFNRAERLSNIAFNAAEAQSGADVTRFFADNSSLSYGGLAAAADKEEQAKRKSEESNYEQQKEQYRLHSRSTEELDKQHQEKLRQIELEGYQARAAIASQFYERMRDQIIAASDLAIEKLETESLNKIIGILNGPGSYASRNVYASRQQQLGTIEAAKKNIEAQEKLLAKAKDAQDQNRLTVAGAQTPAQRDAAQLQLNKSDKEVADIEHRIAVSNKEITDAQNALKDDDRKLQDVLKNQAITAFEEIGNAYMQMLQKQEEARERHVQAALDWNKRELDNQVQSNAQKAANERAYFVQQQNLERERFNQQKKLAGEQMAIDYATSVMKIIASNAGLGPAAAAVDAAEIAGVTAIYFAKLALLNQQQFAGGGEVPGSGGIFGGRSHAGGGTQFIFKGRSFEAEADELAIINKRSASSNRVMTVTGTPKQIASGINAFGGGHDFAPGAKVYKYEYGGSLGAQVQPPTFVGDYYSRKMSGDYQAADMYQMILSQNAVLQEHASAIARESHRPVVLNPHHVTNYQDQHEKSVRVGTL